MFVASKELIIAFFVVALADLLRGFIFILLVF